MNNPTTPPPQAPLSIRLGGVCGVVIGLMDAVIAVAVTLWSVHTLQGEAGKIGPEAVHRASVSVWISCGLCFALSLFALITGLSLLLGWRFGRMLTYALLPLALLTALGCGITKVIGGNLAQLAAQDFMSQGQSFHAYVEVRYWPPAPVLAVLMGILMVVLVSLESSRAWAGRRGAWAPPGTDQALPEPPASRLCIPALLSLILAFVPCLMLTQTAGIVLGIVALVKIRREKGALHGGWMAVTGLILSLLLWLLILLALGAALFFANMKSKSTPPPVPPIEHPVDEPTRTVDPTADDLPTAPPAVEPSAAVPALPEEPEANPHSTGFHVVNDFGLGDDRFRLPDPDGAGELSLYPQALLTGAAVEDAQLMRDDAGNHGIDILWTEAALARLTEVHAQRGAFRLAFVQDGRIVCAPAFRSPPVRRMQITGRWTRDEAADLAKKLRGE